ncbi:acetate/propionate family kinase [Flammeovirga kamogawensis]|uniref:Acetate kinase n=1 Tax=Flammeovirga kamogawensis TaxID=373891 RepID=A0ABX8GX24_9BACT|nr:acetate kinase [Flammeovirga kamogawensis]MBB6460792.1 acetate kinase [Flammeovirga kamogawensis]QWG08145.1 acetate kinase [Flammeovirga kamogawensis]TRX69948.1 acetate kinase [Flammeovirga kamogawensis]
MKILVINAGSSSLKYQLFEMEGTVVLCSGIVERIGLESGIITHKTFDAEGNATKVKKELPIPNHNVGLTEVVALLTDADNGVIQNTDDIQAVGHRVVHGGEFFNKPTVITTEVKEKIRECFQLAPLHNPANLQGIEDCTNIFTKATQVAVFDTAFHQTMPSKSYRYAVPAELYEKNGVRVYGMHGTSHKYVSETAIDYLGLKGKDSKVITIHLGNGCSMSAVRNGECIDTSMGFSPLDGLMMGTRSGDIDPAVVFYLIDKLGMKSDEVYDLLNKKSGMLGITGDSDMRDIEERFNAGDEAAILGLHMYTYRIKKYIGAYMAALNGADAIVFTAGVGENDHGVRLLAANDLEFLGISLDVAKNDKLRASEIEEIQAADSKIKVLVVPTNEELEIALLTQKIVG